ncbi:MAG TPA: radical SAM family heme chaperone HemW [Bacillota bacterium]|jgi:putative oxygen-independent coproporphyrinogen III oxidase|nr:radical SAM family heme chaperone HemW [Bacillota bacterium]
MGGVYVHIPFCVQKCAYCDFVSYPAPDIESLAPAYLHALLGELRLRQDQLRSVAPIDTVYIGGGTPTCVPPHLLAAFLEQLLRAVRAVSAATDTVGPADDIEVTVEANPGTVDHAGLAELRVAGANRLSLGFQSLADEELVALGRIHSAYDCLRAYCDARAAGFGNIGVDLILGAPGQTRGSLENAVAAVIDLGPEHVSAYCLSLEPGTPLADAARAGAVSVPNDDDAADLYDLFVERITASGYARYEISNFARTGFESRHNMGYWRNGEYIGLGAAAHSHVRVRAGAPVPASTTASALDPTTASAPTPGSFDFAASAPAPGGGIRSWNTPKVREYIDAVRRGDLPVAGREMRTAHDEAQDALMVGLRMSVGVDLGALSQEYGVDLVSEYAARFQRLASRGLVEIINSSLDRGTGSHLGPRIRLAPDAFLLANRVFVECV